MTITISQLIEEKTIIKKDFDELNTKVKTVEVELIQMKANLNALNGAMQQTDKLVRMAQESTKK
jgi:predicted  nucleic acid-binding Zn-ribbon protein|tara:strand:+ start:487 stop:678 length:192 start_codon:yes stop_codon:yes gene_type:complete